MQGNDRQVQTFTLSDFGRMLDNAAEKPARKRAPKAH